MYRHPLPVGTRIVSIHGEEDGNGQAAPGAIGRIESSMHLAAPQGWTYHVRFPLGTRAENPDDPDADVVVVVIDQSDSIDDANQYRILDAMAPREASRLLGRGDRVILARPYAGIPEGAVGRVLDVSRHAVLVRFGHSEPANRIIDIDHVQALFRVLPPVSELVIEFHYEDGDVGAHACDGEDRAAAEALWDHFSPSGHGERIVLRRAEADE